MGDVAELLVKCDAICDDGWCAALSASSGVPAATLAAVLAGDRTTKGVPVTVAEALIERLFARDPDAADAAIRDERRRTLTGRLAALRAAAEKASENETRLGLDALLQVMRDLRDNPELTEENHHARVSKVVSNVAQLGDGTSAAAAAVLLLTGTAFDADCSVAGNFDMSDNQRLLSLATRIGSAFGTDQLIALTDALLSEVAPVPLPVTLDADQWARARSALLAAMSSQGRAGPGILAGFEHRDGFAGHARAALAFVNAIPLNTSVKLGSTRGPVRGVAVKIAAWCHSLGVPWFGTGSIAETLGCVDVTPAAGVPSGRIDVLVGAATAAECFDVATEVCTAATAGGTVRRRLPSTELDRLTSLRPAVAVACRALLVGTATRSKFIDVFARACAGEWEHHWDPDEVLAALDADDTFSETLDDSLLTACDSRPLRDTAPTFLVDRVCAHTTLAPWLTHPPTLERLCAAADGIGAGRWAVLVSLLPGFAGTVDELVELTAEVTPTGT